MKSMECCGFKVRHELLIFTCLNARILDPKEIRGMDGDDESRSVRLRQDVTSNARNRHALAQQAASRGRPESDDNARLDDDQRQRSIS
jgi:hypothetical protein